MVSATQEVSQKISETDDENVVSDIDSEDSEKDGEN